MVPSFLVTIEASSAERRDTLPVHGSSRIRRRASEAGVVPQCIRFGPVDATVIADAHAPSCVAISGSVIAIGNVRLDNRDAVARTVESDRTGITDLELALAILWRRGVRGVELLEGDFALLVLDVSTRRGVAARDAFGVRTLYYACNHGHIAFASHAELLAQGEAYDLQYLTEFVAGAEISTERSPFVGVSAVPPASLASLERERIAVRSYWRPFGRDQDVVSDVRTVVEEFRSHWINAVRSRLTSRADVWAELSGGLDSSSVVSTAQVLARDGAVARGVTGTVTFVDSVGAGADERKYSNAVIEAYGIHNEVFVDSLLWEDDGAGPPTTDAPDGRLLLYVRERRVRDAVVGRGGRVLLSGMGSDHYLMGNMLFFADWLASGRIREAAREMLRWAALGRVSFWKLAYLNALLPLLPEPLLRRLAPEGQAPPWIPRSLVSQFGLADRRVVLRSYGGPRCGKYAHEIAVAAASIPAVLDHGPLSDALDIRYPFLHRPLVDFALRLPHALCAQPCRRKWILREVMRGILPEVVRTRQWKGTFDGRSVWCLSRQRQRLERMLRDPIIAQLGCVDPAPLRAALATEVDAPGAGHVVRSGLLQALTLETWLQVRSGRWMATDARAGSRTSKLA